MDIIKMKAIIESILFVAGREVEENEIMSVLEISSEDLNRIINKMQEEYSLEERGIEIIKINNSYQLATKKEYYEYIFPIFDNRAKPTLSPAALEILAIVSYNPKITRPQIESIRGVNSDGTIHKLMEYDLIEESGKLDLPGKPMSFSVTNRFLKMFGLASLKELPELPRYIIDENEQIVLEEINTTMENSTKRIEEENDGE
ncbi:MAG: SMC-Scp complex subunit ScpB [Lachnospiraceae bacterium]|jgi:segregation and condensation protein B|nr:SMC-Scp complex subunit ScpB [Lachnospiraceae bacterium]